MKINNLRHAYFHIGSFKVVLSALRAKISGFEGEVKFALYKDLLRLEDKLSAVSQKLHEAEDLLHEELIEQIKEVNIDVERLTAQIEGRDQNRDFVGA